MCWLSKATNRTLSPRPNNSSRALFPPQAQTIDKDHGRIEDRQLWCCDVEPQTLGLAGVAQLLRVQRIVDTMRQGKVIKHTDDVVYFVTSFLPEEASPGDLLKLIRGHWSIENGQHHRRDRTQDEDRCMVRETNSARVLSLCRSLAIFLHEGQRHKRDGKKSLPDFERNVCRNPGRMIGRFTSGIG